MPRFGIAPQAAPRPPAHRSGKWPRRRSIRPFRRSKSKSALSPCPAAFPAPPASAARAPPRAAHRRYPENRRIRPAPRPAPCCAPRKGRRSAPCESRAHSDAPRSMPPQSPRCRPARSRPPAEFRSPPPEARPARPDTPRCIFPPDKTESPRSTACRSLPPGGNSGLSTAPFCAIINDVCIIAYCCAGGKSVD